MKKEAYSLPDIVSRDEWLKKRKALLIEEKEFTKQHEKINARRRQLPMVEVNKEYIFDGPEGKESLLELFKGRNQLIVQHFMFDPEWNEGCKGCSFQTDNIGNLAHLHARNVTLVLVSRAPLEKLEKFKKRMGWTIPWYSSFDNDFNYDYHVTIDADRGSHVYNYEDISTLGENWKNWKGEQPGNSVFIRKGDSIFHTYSSYERGCELLMGTLNYLDLTALGRQEDWEKPEGRGSDKPGSWWGLHDKY
ncbi:DUF899 domain-containing protein, partial [Arenibacter certesii]|uniref:DUF899 domain-containing protein n=1 Tax=Arenibacter certesii TaxID=228955 RepID=A0A918J0M9_9FLAO